MPQPHPLSFRDYRFYWVARFASTVAQMAMVIVIGWQVYDIARRTMGIQGAAFQLGLIGIVQFLPLALLTLVVGWTADRIDRRWIARGTVSLECGCAALLAWLNFHDQTTLLEPVQTDPRPKASPSESSEFWGGNRFQTGEIANSAGDRQRELRTDAQAHMLGRSLKYLNEEGGNGDRLVAQMSRYPSDHSQHSLSKRADHGPGGMVASGQGQARPVHHQSDPAKLARQSRAPGQEPKVEAAGRADDEAFHVDSLDLEGRVGLRCWSRARCIIFNMRRQQLERLRFVGSARFADNDGEPRQLGLNLSERAEVEPGD